MRVLRKPHPVTMFAVWLLVIFLVLFPKGGFKIGSLPLTWGYLFLALTTPPLLVVRLVCFPLRPPLRLCVVICALIPIQLACIYALLFYGISDTGLGVSTLIVLFFLPWTFLLVYPPFLRYVDGDRLSRYLRISVLLAAVWGIFLFIWHPITGYFIEIPYLTVNAADYGDLEYTKHISRGLFLKLISTYNNGNLYGISMLILLPLYELLETARWRVWVLKLALVLTLSRTVWAGLVVAQVMPLGIVFVRQIATFPRLYLGKVARQFFALAGTVVFILAALLFNASTLSFLFDPNLGGRAGSFGALFNAPLLPASGLSGFSEVLYASVALELGYAGLAAITLLLFSPVLLLFVDSSALGSPVRSAALRGLLLYAFLAVSDGGFNYIPVMVLYWFVYMIYLFGWPAPVPTTVQAKRLVVLPALPVGDSLPVIKAAP